MELQDVNAQREAAIQPAPPVDFVTNESRQKAGRVAPEDLQREILAQLYAQNHLTTVTNTELHVIKSHLTFYTMVIVVSIVASIVILGQ